MTDSGETIYSTMFSSLKHPARRKILRMLSEKALSFSELLEAIEVSSSHLTYHLESLGELISKTQAGEYKLSTFGEAAVNTMRLVEDAPAVQSQNRKYRSLRWKPILAALIIGVVLLAGFSAMQFNNINQMAHELSQLQAMYNELVSFTASTNKSMSFLRDVIQLDLTKYDVTLLSNRVENPSELKGMLEQTLTISLTSTDSKMTVILRFRNNVLSRYQLSVLDGSPIYSGSQPFVVLDSAKWLLQKLRSYEDTSYLETMNRTLYQIPETTNNIQLTDSEMKFNMTVSGDNAEIIWYHSVDDVDFTSKRLKLTFENQVLKELDDSYFLYSIANAECNVDQVGAIQAARNAVKGYSWTSGGQPVIGYIVLDQPVLAVFDPAPREDPLSLVPHWTVTLYLDNLPSGSTINRLSVGVWADTGKTEPVRALSG